MKIVKTIKEFNKIKRKYYKKNSTKRCNKINGKRVTSYWFDKDFVGFLINDTNIFKYLETNSSLNLYLGDEYLINYNSFLYSLLELLNKNPENGVNIVVTNKENETKEYRFYGYLLTNRDIYYYIFDETQMQYFLLTFNNTVEIKK